MGCGTVDRLMARYDLPELDERIPTELIQRLNRIRRCLSVSFVEYELVDIVADYAVVTAELAIALRYKQHFGRIPARHMGFRSLLAWAGNTGLLKGVEGKAQFLRTYRNKNVHPQRDSFGGNAVVAVPRFVFEVVNSLFSVS